MSKRANSVAADFLIDLIRCSLLGEAAPAMPSDCTPVELAQLIRKQHLTNLVYPVFMVTPALADLRKLLERDYLIQIPKVANQDAENKKWLDAAEAKGLDCIPLKGYVLRQLYPNPMMRSMSDFDVLIRNMDNPPIRPWMESMGFVFEEDDDISPHHDNYVKKPWAYMELHRHIMRVRAGRDELEANIWARCTPEPGRKHIYRMSDEDFYIFHLLHMHKHFVEEGCGLKNVIDIFVFLRARGETLDRVYLDNQFKALGIDRFAAYMEHLAFVLLGDIPADEDSKTVTDYLASMDAFGSREQHRVIEVSSGKSKNRTLNKLSFTLRRIFPSPTVLSKHYPSVMKRKFLLPFYWIANAWRVLFVKKRTFSDLKLDGIDDEKYETASRVFTITGTK